MKRLIPTLLITLLATLNNPTPAIHDYFGWTLAAVGSEAVIQDDGTSKTLIVDPIDPGRYCRLAFQ